MTAASFATPSGASPPHALRRARRLAIASGKGGVGKTWLAISLAHALADAGQRILLFDGDIGLANVDVQLGLVPRADIGAVLHGRCSIQDACERPADLPFDVLAGASGSGSLASLSPSGLSLLLGQLGELPYDMIVLDLGAGLDASLRTMARWADTLLVVVTDEPTSLTDAYAVLKLYWRDCAAAGGEDDAHVVVNMAASLGCGQRTHDALGRACRQFLGRAPSLAGVIGRDPRVRESVGRQVPLLTRYPSSPAADAVRRVAAALAPADT